MAKQRGIHQIIGKYNDTCYFERKGTRGGLLRRINSGMSERVKTGEEYSNLRATNSVFGACSLYASIVFNMFSNRALFLFKKNRQSLLTKLLFKGRALYFLDGDGLRAGFLPGDSQVLARLFDNVVKKKFFDIFSGISRNIFVDDTGLDYTFTLLESDLYEYCRKYNAEGCYVSVVGPCYIYRMERQSVKDKFSIPEFGNFYARYGYRWVIGDGDLEVTFNVGEIDDAAVFGFIYAIPEKDIMGGRGTRLNNGACCGMFSIFIG